MVRIYGKTSGPFRWEPVTIVEPIIISRKALARVQRAMEYGTARIYA